jgi:hypothetical protein
MMDKNMLDMLIGFVGGCWSLLKRGLNYMKGLFESFYDKSIQMGSVAINKAKSLGEGIYHFGTNIFTSDSDELPQNGNDHDDFKENADENIENKPTPVTKEIEKNKLYIHVEGYMLPYLQSLGIERLVGDKLTKSDLKTAFKTKCILVHPDKGIEKNADLFIEIKSAFDKLNKFFSESNESDDLQDVYSEIFSKLDDVSKRFNALQQRTTSLESKSQKISDDISLLKEQLEKFKKDKASQHSLFEEKRDNPDFIDKSKAACLP